MLEANITTSLAPIWKPSLLRETPKAPLNKEEITEFNKIEQNNKKRIN
jgi:hypothetical protein